MKTIADDRTRARMKARVSSLSLRSPRRWGKMNVQQMLTHLAGGMELVLNGEPLGAAAAAPRTAFKIFALHMPIPWPRGIRSSRDPAGRNVPDTQFEALRDRVLAGLDAMAAWEKGPDTAPHPGFGDLTTWEWHRWAYRHADHHLKQFSA